MVAPTKQPPPVEDDDESFREPLNVDDAEENLQALLRITKPEHWFDYGEDAGPSLKRSGCDLAGAAFQISVVGSVERQHEDFDDGKTKLRLYHASGKFCRSGLDRVIDAQGSCGTDEPCFSSRPWLQKSEVLTQARSKADTRMWNDAIRRLIGIGSITWEDLEVRGIARDHVQKKKGKEERGGRGNRNPPTPPHAAHTSPPAAAPPADPMTDVQKTQISTYSETLGLSAQDRGTMLTAAGWRRGEPVSKATATAVLGELARLCKTRSVNDPVTGEVHEPASAPTATPEKAAQSAPAKAAQSTPPDDDDIPF